MHGNSRLGIRQSARPGLCEEFVPASRELNEMSISALNESAADSAVRAAASPRVQTRSGSPASDRSRLHDAITTNNSIGSQCSIQEAVGCRSPSESPESSVRQSPGADEPTAIPIDPVILSDECPLESGHLYQDTRDNDVIWPGQQEMPCPYPEPPIIPQSIFDNDHLSLGLIDGESPATHRHGGEQTRQIRPGNNAEGNGFSPQGPQQQHRSSDVNRVKRTQKTNV